MQTLFPTSIDQFLEYLNRQRCMTPQSVYNYGLFLRRVELELRPRSLFQIERGSEIEKAIWEAAKKRKMKYNGGSMTDDGQGWRFRAGYKVSNYLRWAFREKLIERNPYPENTFKAPYRPRAGFLTEEQLQHLYTCDRLDIRDMMMIRFFYDTGLRISEVVNVKIDDIHYDENIVTAYSSKEHRWKSQPFTDETKYWIQVVLGMRHFRSEWLFCDPETGKKSTDKSVRLRFRKISEMIRFRIHPHMMRHTAGTHIAKHVGQMQAMQHLGHSSVQMTNHYIHLTGGDLRENQKLLSDKMKAKKNVLIGA